MSYEKVSSPDASQPAKIDANEAWLNCTEDLIFAAAYYDDPACGSIAWRRELDKRCLRHNEQDEDRKCREVCLAINALSPRLGTQLERAHAANEHPTFRLQRMGHWPTADALTVARSSGRKYHEPTRSAKDIQASRDRMNEIMARAGL